MRDGHIKRTGELLKKGNDCIQDDFLHQVAIHLTNVAEDLFCASHYCSHWGHKGEYDWPKSLFSQDQV